MTALNTQIEHSFLSRSRGADLDFFIFKQTYSLSKDVTIIVMIIMLLCLSACAESNFEELEGAITNNNQLSDDMVADSQSQNNDKKALAKNAVSQNSTVKQEYEYSIIPPIPIVSPILLDSRNSGKSIREVLRGLNSRDLDNEPLEEKLQRLFGVKELHEVDKTKLSGPTDFRKLADIYFDEGDSFAAYQTLEYVALYSFSTGRELARHYEGQKNYTKAFFYYVLSGPDIRKKYNPERIKALNPAAARLLPYLTPKDHKWVESEIKRHLDTFEEWAREEMTKNTSE